MQKNKKNKILGVFLDSASFGTPFDFSALPRQLPKLEKEIQWTFFEQTHPDGEEIFRRTQAANIIITNKVSLSRLLLQRLSQLQLICISATGINHIDLSAAQECGVAVSNVPNYSTDSVAQLVMTFILQHATQFLRYQQEVANGGWSRSGRFGDILFPLHELQGQRLGIVGYGNIGQKVASLAKAFGMEVVIAQRAEATSANLSPLPARTPRIPFAEVLATSDYLSLHCPFSPATQELMGAKELQQMKKTAVLINTSRGGLVHSPSLRHALEQGQIAGAALDVLDQEPPPLQHPLLYPTMPQNLWITPHIGWATLQARQRLVQEMALNIAAFFQGQKRHRVDIQ